MTKSSLIKTVTTAAASIALLLSALLIHSCTDENGIDSAFLKQRKENAEYAADSDGKKYRTVKVGNVTWLAENVNRKTHNSWCYDGADFNCEKYGRLYSWRDAMFSACPNGWHLPMNGEWADLEEASGKEAAALRAKSWDGRDKYGWTALPGGSRKPGSGSGVFEGLNEYGRWWGGAFYAWGDSAESRGVGPGDNTLSAKYHKKQGLSVRCVADDAGAKRYRVTIDLAGGVDTGAAAGPQSDFGEMTVSGTTESGVMTLYSHFLFAMNIKPYLSGYRFTGWSDGKSAAWNDETPITGDMAFTARWVKQVTVTLDRNDGGGAQSPRSVTADSGKAFGEAVAGVHDSVKNPRRPRFVFEGWFDGETQYIEQTVIDRNVTLKAQWRDAVKYTVTFNTDGGSSINPNPVTVDSGTVFKTFMPANPSKQGNRFAGWYDGATQYNENTIINGHVTLNAKWDVAETILVTLNANGGKFSDGTTASKTVNAAYDAPFSESMPPDPTRTSYLFTGWYDGSNKQYTAATVITAAVTLTAQWRAVPNYTVSFNTNGGTPSIASAQADSGTLFGTIMPAANPSKTDNAFMGWYDGNTEYTAATPITKTVTLQAKYEAVVPVSGTMTDPRDGTVYRTVKLGRQTWMAENLNFETNEGSSCYKDEDSYCDKYGRLYDWETAMIACPTGWHLSTNDEWTALAITAGGTGTNGASGTAAKKLKAASGWPDCSSGYSCGGSNGTDDYGFTALRVFDNGRGSWWTATESGTNSIYRSMDRYYDTVLYNSTYLKDQGLSVRCLADD